MSAALRFSQVGVVGLGTMGAGIASVLATNGIDVVGIDTSQERLDAATEQLAQFAAGAVARGKLEAAGVDRASGCIALGTDLSAAATCDLVIESVTEEPDLKNAILRSIASVVTAECVIATNTSSLSVTELAASVVVPERFLGIHFFNPVPSMRLVEVVTHPLTDADTVEAVATFVTALGKKVLTVADRPGFIVNSVLIPYLNQAIEELDGALADPDVVDRAVRLGLGYRVGPYELLEMIGHETQLRIAEQAYAQTHRPEMAPPPLLRRLVAERSLTSGRPIRSNPPTTEGSTA